MPTTLAGPHIRDRRAAAGLHHRAVLILERRDPHRAGSRHRGGRQRIRLRRRFDVHQTARSAIVGVGRPAEVLDAPVDVEHRLIAPRLVTGLGGEEVQSDPCPRAHTIKLMLDPPPRTLPIDNGMRLSLACGFGVAAKFQSRSPPRFNGH